MSAKLNPVSIGSFVIGGVILIAIGLMSFQSLAFINKPIRFISYFDESVQGLGIGSDVKLRGVAVGRVVAIHVHYDLNDRKSEIVVISELNRNAVSDRSGKIIPIADRPVLEQLVQDGLRAKINLVGITGLQIVQLDFLDPSKHLAGGTPDHNSSYPVIPTVNSGMSQLADNLVDIAESVRKIDFGKISTDFSKTENELNTFLVSLNQKTEELDLKNLQLQKMTSKITDAATAIKQLADYLGQNPSSLIFGRKK